MVGRYPRVPEMAGLACTDEAQDRLYEWLRQHPTVPDALLAGALFLVLAVPAAVTYEPGWPHLVIGAAIYGCLAFRRVRPVESFIGVAAAGLVQWATGVELTAATAGILLSLYSTSAYGPRWGSRAGLVVGQLGSGLAMQRYALFEGGGAFVAGLGMSAAVVVGVWALGDVRRERTHPAAPATHANMDWSRWLWPLHVSSRKKVINQCSASRSAVPS